MDAWVVGQISFWYTVRKVKPAAIVDKVVEIFLDIVVPGRGAGENNWYVGNFRSRFFGNFGVTLTFFNCSSTCIQVDERHSNARTRC
jgi:hypothetical protein